MRSTNQAEWVFQDELVFEHSRPPPTGPTTTTLAWRTAVAAPPPNDFTVKDRTGAFHIFTPAQIKQAVSQIPTLFKIKTPCHGALLEKAAERHLGYSSFVSIGNKADVSSNDLLEWWEDEDETEAAESFELPGADLSNEELSIEVVPKQDDEFTCSVCFLVHHRSARMSENPLVCRECA